MSNVRDNSGAWFVNDRKEKDTHPDFKGSAVIQGVEYWVSGWRNTSAKGTKYHSMSFTPKEEAHSRGMNQARKAAAPQPQQSYDDFEDDIPF